MALPMHVTDGFNLFWNEYPKRPNNSKHTARLAWAKALRTATITEIMDGLARYQFSDDPKYRPMAATWLNRRAWEVVNEDLTIDAYGLSEWLAALPRDGALSATCYDVDELRPILVATGWPATWRGSLDVLGGWMKDGYVPDSCAKVIAEAVAMFGGRANLGCFDKRVRYRAERMGL